MKKKLLTLILCICLITTFCIQPVYAMGAEGAIIGGGMAAAGISLTMPQVAILVAAGFGLVYATTHAEELANGLNNALESAAQNISNGVEELTYWKEQAAKGVIALSSAPSWINANIKNWVGGLFENSGNEIVPNYGCVEYPAGVPVPNAHFWTSNPSTNTFNQDVVVLRASIVEEINVSGGAYLTLMSYCVAVSTKSIGWSSTIIDGTTYYYHYSSSGANPSLNKPLAGDNLLMFEALSALPNYRDLSDAYPSLNSWADILIKAWLDGRIGSTTGSICPDAIVGGIEGAMDTHGIDNIKVPDLDIGGSKLLTPDNTADGSIDDVLDGVLTGLKEKEISWEQYMNDVSVGVPTVSIPQEGNPPLDFPITDTGVSDIPIDTTIPSNPSVEVPEGLSPFTMSLSDFFPFCIPFDIADFVNVLCAEPEAPSFEWVFPSVDGTTEKLTIDLSPFDSVAQLLRNMEILLFCIGLALMTRNQIRG